MDLTAQSPRRTGRGLRAGRLALALLLTAPLSLVRAGPETDRAMPPDYPDLIHVLNGCYISTAAYLARFHAQFPAEQATSLAVEPIGYPTKHTIAVVSWRGRWWGRDEYFGVFGLECAVASAKDPGRLVRRAEAALTRQIRSELRAGREAWVPSTPPSLDVMERSRLVTQAAALLPFASELFWVGDGREAIPLLFFRPSPGWVAVYDPLSGTGRAECSGPDTTRIIRSFALRLGYRATAVRPDFSHEAGVQVAGLNPTPGAPAR